MFYVLFQNYFTLYWRKMTKITEGLLKFRQTKLRCFLYRVRGLIFISATAREALHRGFTTHHFQRKIDKEEI